MFSEMRSMLKLMLEEQERGLAWHPTNYQGAYEPSTSREYQPDQNYAQGNQWGYEQEQGLAWHPTCYQGAYEPSTSREYQPDLNYAQGNQWGYDERFQSSDMEYDYGTPYSSQTSMEEIFNLTKLLLEEQEKYSESIRMINIEMGARTQDSRVAETTLVETINTELPQWMEEEEEEEECIPVRETSIKEVIPNDIGEGLEGNAQIKDAFLQEAEESIKEIELLLECTVDENLVIRCKEQVELVVEPVVELVVEPMAEPVVEPMVIISYSTKSNEERVSTFGKTFEDHSKGVLVVAYIVDKNLGITSIYKVRIDEPRKIIFEKIRMKKFRGWFYDEYDPGDTWSSSHNSQPSFRLNKNQTVKLKT